MLMVGVLLEMFGLVGWVYVYVLTCTHVLAVSALTKIMYVDIGSIATVMVLAMFEAV